MVPAYIVKSIVWTRIGKRLPVLLLLITLGAVRVDAAEPSDPRFVIPMNSAPQFQSGLTVNSSDQRDAAIKWNACGLELDFLESQGAVPTQQLIAKATWLASGTTGALRRAPVNCVQQFWVRRNDLPLDWGWNVGDAELIKHINTRFSEAYRVSGLAVPNPLACDQPVFSSISIGTNYSKLEASISEECMKNQVAIAVSKIQPGTIGTPLPCMRDIGWASGIGSTGGPVGNFIASSSELISTLTKKTHGDYDMTLKELVRLYYIATLQLRSTSVLHSVTTDRISRELFTVSGDLEAESYPLLGCGNTERDQGSAEDRLDEDIWLDDAADTLGDIVTWLALFMLIVIAVVVVLIAAVAILGSGLAAGAVAGAAAIVGVTTATMLPAIRFPETENHLLMINTSRYLINQVLADQRSMIGDTERQEQLAKYQAKTRDWLLRRLQRIVNEDFIEYNSIPYADHAIPPIQNLHDFAKDPQLKIAAQMVLDMALLKTAASSHQGRRMAPFRRLGSDLRDRTTGSSITDPYLFFSEGLDHYATLLLYYTRQFDQLEQSQESLMGNPPTNPTSGLRWVSKTMVKTWVYAATSNYAPHPRILELALKGRAANAGAYHYQARHGGVEIYSGASAFVLSAGGIRSDPSDRLFMPFDPTDFPGGIVPGNRGRCIDVGVAKPTTLFLAGGTSKRRYDSMLRFDGTTYWVQKGETLPLCSDRDDSAFVFKPAPPLTSGEPGEPFDDKGRPGTWAYTHDHNTCVYKGFACGTNLKIPAGPLLNALDASGAQPGPFPGSVWRFLDSGELANGSPRFSELAPNRPEQRFYLAVLESPCPEGLILPCTNFGLVEVISNPGSSFSFDQFKVQVIGNNALLSSTAAEAGGHFREMLYRTSAGDRIRFKIRANAVDRKYWDIVAVNGKPQPDIPSWRRVSGNLLEEMSPGIFVLSDDSGIISRTYDFSDFSKPRIR